MNNRTELTTTNTPSGQLLATVPAGSPAPVALPHFRDLDAEIDDQVADLGFAAVTDDTRHGVFYTDHEAPVAGVGVTVEMWVRTDGETMTVSPAYVRLHVDQDRELDGPQAAALAVLLRDAAALVASADAEILGRLS